MQIYFGLNVKYLRKTRKIEREDLAAHFNIHLSSVSHWERGKHLPKVEDVVRLAEYFNVSVDDLLLKNLEQDSSMVKEKSEPYLSASEKNSQEIMALTKRLEALERWRAEIEKKE